MTSNEPAAEILIALGANIPSWAGLPAQTLDAALADLGEAGVCILRVSRFYRTQAWPDPAAPTFTNAVAAVETALSPLSLLACLHKVETSFGRKRSAKNAPRTLDLDLLDYRGQILEGKLVLPHPRIQERAFVLEPLREVSPFWRHPVSGASVKELLAALSPLPESPLF